MNGTEALELLLDRLSKTKDNADFIRMMREGA